MNHTILMFLKFGKQEHIQDLYENGTLYFRPIQDFRKLEDNGLRGDSYEGAIEVINSLPGTFTIPGIKDVFNYKKVHLKQSYEETLGNIYSLYCISSVGFPDPHEFRIDPRVLEFGSHCLMIKDNQYFLDKIEEILTLENYKFWHGFVDYYDKDSVSKNLTVFEKPLKYEYQKEFRFYIENEQIEPIKIQIGSLKDRAEIITSEDVIQLQLQAQ